jgi:hypothetical protein
MRYTVGSASTTVKYSNDAAMHVFILIFQRSSSALLFKPTGFGHYFILVVLSLLCALEPVAIHHYTMCFQNCHSHLLSHMDTFAFVEKIVFRLTAGPGARSSPTPQRETITGSHSPRIRQKQSRNETNQVERGRQYNGYSQFLLNI